MKGTVRSTGLFGGGCCVLVRRGSIVRDTSPVILRPRDRGSGWRKPGRKATLVVAIGVAGEVGGGARGAVWVRVSAG
jgi:hypothetical protein